MVGLLKQKSCDKKDKTSGAKYLQNKRKMTVFGLKTVIFD